MASYYAKLAITKFVIDGLMHLKKRLPPSRKDSVFESFFRFAPLREPYF